MYMYVYLQEIGEFVGVMGIDVDISNIIQNELQKYNVSQSICYMCSA